MIMHIEKRLAVIALTTEEKTELHLIDLDNNNKILKEFNIGESIEYWKWIDDKILGIVGSTNVFHINITTGICNSIFRRISALAEFTIQNYEVCSEGKWHSILGS